MSLFGNRNDMLVVRGMLTYVITENTTQQLFHHNK